MVSEVKFYNNIPFNLYQQDTYDYPNKTAQNQFFLQRVIEDLPDATFDIRLNTIKMKYFDGIWNLNYCSIQMEQTERIFYFFVTGVKLLNGNTCELSLIRDDFQTFLFEHTLEECLVETAHVPRWDSANIKPILWSSDVSRLDAIQVPTLIKNIADNDYNIQYINIVASKRFDSLTGKGISFYTIPYYGNTNLINSVNNNNYIKGLDFALNQLAETDLEGIMSACISPLGFNDATYNNISGGVSVTWEYESGLAGDELIPGSINQYVHRCSPDALFNQHILNFDYTHISKPLRNDSTVYSYLYEPMLFKSPFMERFIIDYDGNKILDIPPFNVFNDDTNIPINFMLRPSLSGLRLECYVNQEEFAQTGGYFSSIPLPLFDMMNSPGQTYRATQRDFDRRTLQEQLNQNNLKQITGGLQSGAVGFIGGGPLGLLTSGLGILTGTANALIDNHYSQKLQKIEEEKISAQNRLLVSNGDAGKLLFENDSLAQPRNKTCKFIESKAYPNTFDKWANIFHKNGYTINRVIKPNTKSRRRFNFIMTDGAVVSGNLNPDIKQSLANIYNSGIRIWHYPVCNMYDYSKENWEVY